jgi:Clp amino terminal domain, pathogenicity island component
MERTAQVEALVLRVVGGDDPLTRLQALNALRSELDSLEAELAAQALRAGMSWREIGGALGVSKQAAHRRHSQSVATIEDADARQPAGFEVGVSVAARRAVRLARREAARLGVREVGTEHLLLGLVQCGDRGVSEVLDRLGVTLGATRDAVEPTTGMTLEAARRTRADTGAAGGTSAALSAVAKSTLERALKRASARGAGRLTALDILYCVLAHRDTGAARTLERLGVDAGSARDRIAQLEAAA